MKKRLLLLLVLPFLFLNAESQNRKTETATTPSEGFTFKTIADIKATPVLDQARTLTCWSFATTSFFESEMMRLGKPETDLSEMFIVRENYKNRLKDNYLRQGSGNTGEGGLPHDWIKVFRDRGIIPADVYPGKNYDSPYHDHSELNAFIVSTAGIAVKRRNESPEYYKILNAILDTYLGTVPTTFTFRGVSYTPESFASSTGIIPDDYVEITSFTHIPFYAPGLVEVPDNWAMAKPYNVRIDELMAIIENALTKGYTVDWDGDTSEKGFSHQNGVAVNPADPGNFSFSGPVKEAIVTQESRQEGYESFETTDDHGMHITGMVTDQNGTKYFKTKNSWGTDRSKYQGYLNMSESYVRAKTILILVHKDAIPAPIRTKLGI